MCIDFNDLFNVKKYMQWFTAVLSKIQSKNDLKKLNILHKTKAKLKTTNCGNLHILFFLFYLVFLGCGVVLSVGNVIIVEFHVICVEKVIKIIICYVKFPSQAKT